jgi:hypothetical protein
VNRTNKMPINPKNLMTIVTDEITHRVMEGSMSMREIDSCHDYLDREYILNALAQAEREKFMKEQFRRFRAELIMRTADVFDVTEDMAMGFDGDREYVQDIYIKERFSDDEDPRIIKQFPDNHLEDEEWNDFMEFIRENRKKEIMEEIGDMTYF